MLEITKEQIIKTATTGHSGFEIGDKVIHINHGKGIIEYFDPFEFDVICVKFNKKPDGWCNPLCVSINCLRKERWYI